MREVLKKEEALNWRAEMNKEIKTFDEMMCWDLANPPKDEKRLHQKYVLKKRSAASKISKRKAIFAAYGNEEHSDDEAFSLVAYFTVAKTIFVSCYIYNGKYDTSISRTVFRIGI